MCVVGVDPGIATVCSVCSGRRSRRGQSVRSVCAVGVGLGAARVCSDWELVKREGDGDYSLALAIVK